MNNPRFFGQTIHPGDTVRGLVPIQIESYVSPCDAGYQYTVAAVHGDGTVRVYRDELGTVPHYATVPLAAVELAYRIVNGVHYSSRGPAAVVAVLEDARTSGTGIRVSKGYTEQHLGRRLGDKPVGEDWLETFGVEGTIGTSTGRVRVPLLIHSARSTGGGVVDGGCIVRIKDTRTGRVLYQHTAYRLPALAVQPLTAAERRRTANQRSGLTHRVTADGRTVARFGSAAKADSFIAKFR